MIILAVCVDGENTVEGCKQIIEVWEITIKNFFLIFSVLISSGMTCGQRDTRVLSYSTHYITAWGVGTSLFLKKLKNLILYWSIAN